MTAETDREYTTGLNLRLGAVAAAWLFALGSAILVTPVHGQNKAGEVIDKVDTQTNQVEYKVNQVDRITDKLKKWFGSKDKPAQQPAPAKQTTPAASASEPNTQSASQTQLNTETAPASTEKTPQAQSQ